jgi:MinD-like ATPase involved in chromosome partitioning or flagellar assembly
MTQLRVIKGGEQATAVQADDFPVPVTHLNPDPSAAIRNKFQYAPGEDFEFDNKVPRYARSQQATDSQQVYGRYSMQSAVAENLRESFAQPLSANTVAIVSLQRGVGTSTIAAHLAAVFASFRPGGVSAIDGDPELSVMSRDLTAQSASEFHVSPAALKNRETICAQAIPAPSGVEVLGTPQNLHANPTDAATFARAVRHHFDTVVIDAPANTQEAVNRVLLSSAHVAVVITGPNRAGVRAAEEMIELLNVSDHSPHDIVVVINGVPRSGGRKFISQTQQYFAARVGGVALLPLVEDLTEQVGRPVTIEKMPQQWRISLENLANVVVNRLRSHAIIDVDEVEIDRENGGAELRVVPTMSDHDAEISLAGNTPVVTSRLGSQANSYAPNEKGDT